MSLYGDKLLMRLLTHGGTSPKSSKKLKDWGFFDWQPWQTENISPFCKTLTGEFGGISSFLISWVIWVHFVSFLYKILLNLQQTACGLTLIIDFEKNLAVRYFRASAFQLKSATDSILKNTPWKSTCSIL